jgi:Phospholipase_D-nuclease N-terminal
MVLADVSLGQLTWTMLFLFMLAAFVWVFILAVGHLFRDREMSGWARAGWLVGLIIFPLFGSLAYLLVRGAWVTDDSAAGAAARAQFTRTEVERRHGSSVADSADTGPGGPM